MSLIPNTPFTDGTVYTAEIAYLAFNQVFDDQPQYLGHKTRISDNDLSNSPGQVKDRLNQATGQLKVSGTTLTLSYTSGLVLVNNSLVTIPSGLIVVANNNTSYVYINGAGAVVTGLTLPVNRVVLAKVTTVSGNVTSLEDWRGIGQVAVSPVPSAIRVFGGNSPVDKVCTNGEVLDQGLYTYRDFTVPVGVSITISKLARVVCSGNVVIDGVVNVSTFSSGAIGYGTGLIPNFNVGGASGSGACGGSGSSSTTSGTCNYIGQSYGSGGGQGFAQGTGGSVTSGTAGLGTAGAGGGGLIIEASGSISVTGNILANGTNAALPNMSGEGMVSGSGGGSGGLVYLSSLVSCTLSGTVNVSGGSGSSGIKSGSVTISAQGGGGGGGGWVVLASPANNTTLATLSISGGTPGIPTPGTGGIGGGTGGGYAGAGGTSNANGSVGRFLSLTLLPVV